MRFVSGFGISWARNAASESAWKAMAVSCAMSGASGGNLAEGLDVPNTVASRTMLLALHVHVQHGHGHGHGHGVVVHAHVAPAGELCRCIASSKHVALGCSPAALLLSVSATLGSGASVSVGGNSLAATCSGGIALLSSCIASAAAADASAVAAAAAVFGAWTGAFTCCDTVATAVGIEVAATSALERTAGSTDASIASTLAALTSSTSSVSTDAPSTWLRRCVAEIRAA